MSARAEYEALMDQMNPADVRETEITPYDEWGNALTTRKSNLRSSLGETGHITGNHPERPYHTAQRGMLEELGLCGDDIADLVSIGSLLRIKKHGHHKFPPLSAEDRTHYFKAVLARKAVRPAYYNNEYGPDGKQLNARIKLEWFLE